MSRWLVARYEVSHRTAVEWVRVGHALDELPEIRHQFRSGRLSWDHVRTVTRFAAIETDAELADQAPEMSVSNLQRRARQVAIEDTTEAHRRRYLRWWWNEAVPVLHLEGRLPDEQGIIVARALDRIAQDRLPDPSYPNRDQGIYEPYEARCADALTRMASQALGADSDPDRASVVVHVDAAALRAGNGVGEVEDGPALIPETVLRLACDARIQAAVNNDDGRPVGIGRVSRSIPASLARQVARRDHGCVFPGCDRTRWVHRHHLVHWAHGGPTDLDNLVTLCGYHHRLVHEDGWTISGVATSALEWTRPDGTIFAPKVPPMPLAVRRRIAEQATSWHPPRRRGTALTDTS